MAFPNLTLESGGVLHSSATGVPSNGDNTIAHGISGVDDADWLDVEVAANGPSITGAALTSKSATNVVINFTQTGADTATVRVGLKHSIVR